MFFSSSTSNLRNLGTLLNFFWKRNLKQTLCEILSHVGLWHTKSACEVKEESGDPNTKLLNSHSLLGDVLKLSSVIWSFPLSWKQDAFLFHWYQCYRPLPNKYAIFCLQAIFKGTKFEVKWSKPQSPTEWTWWLIKGLFLYHQLSQRSLTMWNHSSYSSMQITEKF